LVSAAAVFAEASPAALVGAGAGAVALAGGVAVVVASQHSEAQEERLQGTIRERPRHRRLESHWKGAARKLMEVLQWYLAPQKEGMPQVYHGSPWRSRAREGHLAEVRALLGPEEASASGGGGAEEDPWADLVFLYSLWLEYNPHTANWGVCPSYGLPSQHHCWHNRWREDLRHAGSALARRFLSPGDQQGFRDDNERNCALCLLGTLDHVLSWDVSTPHIGRSDLLPRWRLYPSFCSALRERFACAWAAAQAPPAAELELESFDAHVEAMAAREVPRGFRDIW